LVYERLYSQIERNAKSVNKRNQPVTIHQATVKSVNEAKATCKVKYDKDNNEQEDTIPILQPNYELENHTDTLTVGEYTITLDLEHEFKLKIQKGDRVLVGFIGGDLGDGVILGRI